MVGLASSTLVLAAGILQAAQLVTAETVFGAYIFHRHGDRTAKILPPTVLTDLGYDEIFARGSYYHARYLSTASTYRISGINENIVSLSQLTVSAPTDNVLQNSALGWLQGLYPPVGTAANQTLANGTTVTAPLNGYQLIPVGSLSSGSSSESSGWLQGSTGCLKAELSSNDYFASPAYNSLLSSTGDFYTSLNPMLNRTFSSSHTSCKNAYTIWDYLNVAAIHNSSAEFPSRDLLTQDVFNRLFDLANVHEWNLAYNASEPVRAIAGAALAGQVLAALNSTVSAATYSSSPKLNIQFGAYNSFFSYFGLAQLPTSGGPQFLGIPDYASSMIWELVANSSSLPPPASDVSVRFYFHNGTSASSADPTEYPLFGQSNTLLSWSDFVSETTKFAVSSQTQWCQACGNSTGTCAGTGQSSTGSGSSPSSTASSSSGSGSGISAAVGGVIGAMVTLGVILGLEALILIVGGFRLTKKRASNSVVGGEGNAGSAVVGEK
jgi:hypothetical protein